MRIAEWKQNNEKKSVKHGYLTANVEGNYFQGRNQMRIMACAALSVILGPPLTTRAPERNDLTKGLSSDR